MSSPPIQRMGRDPMHKVIVSETERYALQKHSGGNYPQNKTSVCSNWVSFLESEELGSEEKKPVLKRRVPAPSLCGFCGRFHVRENRKPAEEKFCRTPKVLQNFGSQAQFSDPANS